MTTVDIQVKESVPIERVEDLLCTMYETSPMVAAWAEVSGETKPTKEAQYRWQYPTRGGSLFIKDIEADNGETYELDGEAVKRGLQVMVRDYPQHWADFRKDNEDAITADVFLQCALFGEVIYG